MTGIPAAIVSSIASCRAWSPGSSRTGWAGRSPMQTPCLDGGRAALLASLGSTSSDTQPSRRPVQHRRWGAERRKRRECRSARARGTPPSDPAPRGGSRAWSSYSPAADRRREDRRVRRDAGDALRPQPLEVTVADESAGDESTRPGSGRRRRAPATGRTSFGAQRQVTVRRGLHRPVLTQHRRSRTARGTTRSCRARHGG